MKRVFEAIFAWLGILWIMFSPFVVLLSSVLTTINWYLVSNSVVQGILGFVVGGLLGGIVMGLGILIIAVVAYYFQKEKL